MANFYGLLPKNKGQNLALTVLIVPNSLDSGRRRRAQAHLSRIIETRSGKEGRAHTANSTVKLAENDFFKNEYAFGLHPRLSREERAPISLPPPLSRSIPLSLLLPLPLPRAVSLSASLSLSLSLPLRAATHLSRVKESRCEGDGRAASTSKCFRSLCVITPSIKNMLTEIRPSKRIAGGTPSIKMNC